MKRILKAGAFMVVLFFSLASCQEELPTPEDVPSQEKDPSGPDPDRGKIN